MLTPLGALGGEAKVLDLGTLVSGVFFWVRFLAPTFFVFGRPSVWVPQVRSTGRPECSVGAGTSRVVD